MKPFYLAFFRLFAGMLAATQSLYGQFTQPLFVPDTLSGPVFNLSIGPGQKSFLPGNLTPTLSYNQFGFLGPTLIMKRGWAIETTVQNQLSDTTTLHWHGLHIAAHVDGGPHVPILPGQQWNPHFTCMDKAGTYWYHPHFHGKTAIHTLKGAAGLIIVRDAEESGLGLPSRYGQDDFPLILQSLELNPANEILPAGQQDSIVLVNGNIKPFLQVPSQWVRFRLLNASNARNFYVGFADNRTFKLIGSDGGLLGRPLDVTRIKMAPGERNEILVDFSGQASQIIRLKSFGSEIPNGTQGGPTIPSPPGFPSTDSPLNGKDFDLLELQIGPANGSPVILIPDSLAVQRRIPESESNNERFIAFSSAIPGSSHGPFLLNDSTFRMDRIDFRIPVNTTEIWNIHNQTTVAHPFHLHGFQFYILDRFGSPVGPEERGRKDMVMVNPNETLRIITRFSNFADSTMPYMYHCHIFTHEDEGMMGQFVVIPVITSSVDEMKEASAWVHPNPIQNYFEWGGFKEEPEVRNVLGQKLQLVRKSDKVIDCSTWPAGMYFLSDGSQTIRLLKNSE